MRYLSVFLAIVIALPLSPIAGAQTAGPMLNLTIVEGDGAINNIRQRTAREPIVQVEDENHRPVAGAVVVFLLPNQGAGGTFAGGAHSLTVITDSQGRAAARGLRPNNLEGKYQIHVNVSHSGQTANTVITQTNLIGAGAGAGASAGVSGKLIAVLVIVGAAAAGGAAWAVTHSGGNNSNNASIPPGQTLTSITAGTGLVGPPK